MHLFYLTVRNIEIGRITCRCSLVCLFSLSRYKSVNHLNRHTRDYIDTEDNFEVVLYQQRSTF